MKKEEILLETDRIIRKGNGSILIALPPEVLKVLKVSDGNKLNFIILKSGKVQIEKGDK